MKKIVKLSVLVLTSLVFTGCGSKEIITECVRTGTIREGVSVDFNYKVTSKGGVVLKVETVEKVTSQDEEYLKTFKDSILSMYAPYKDIKDYNYEVTIEGDTLVSKTNIDYTKVDTDKLVEIDSANSKLIKNGKVSLDDVTNLYNSTGAVCQRVK